MQKSLVNLLNGLTNTKGIDDVVVNGLADHSGMVSQGFFYLAMQGQQAHGIDFLDEAITKGAVAAAYESDSKLSVNDTRIPLIAVPKLRHKVGDIANRFYDSPSDALQVTTITGTNGKTSTAFLIAQALRQKYGQCGLFGTLGYGEFKNLKPAINTTPSALRLHAEMYELVQSDVVHAVLEASSQGLAQERLSGVNIDVAVFTMLGRDHFDYHKSLKNYKAAKKKLFEYANLQWAILNLDDKFGRELRQDDILDCQVLTYSSQGDQAADLTAANIKVNINGLSFEVCYQQNSVSIRSHLLGRFNVDSLLAAFAVLLAYELPMDIIGDLLNSAEPVPGRMQLFSAPGQPYVIVDYAHTPDALESVLQSCREMGGGKLHCVFGCGGNRDKGKRALMGEVATRLSDYVVLTDDNPRHENPKQIVQDILSGVTTDKPVDVEHDRGNAIKIAIENSHPNDYVLVAGKGNEAYQEIGDMKLPLSDQQLIQQIFVEKQNVVA